MWLFNQPSSAARTALAYITVGALTVIWAGVWYIYLHNNPPQVHGVYYVCGGSLVTGLTLVLIGLGLGRIGRSARHADLPPQEVHAAVVNAGQNGMVPGPVVAAINPSVPSATPESVAAVPVHRPAGPVPVAGEVSAGTVP